MLSPLHSSSVAVRQDILITSHLSFSLLIWEHFSFSSCIKSPIVSKSHASTYSFLSPQLLWSLFLPSCLSPPPVYISPARSSPSFCVFTVSRLMSLNLNHSQMLILSTSYFHYTAVSPFPSPSDFSGILRSQSGTPLGN